MTRLPGDSAPLPLPRRHGVDRTSRRRRTAGVVAVILLLGGIAGTRAYARPTPSAVPGATGRALPAGHQAVGARQHDGRWTGTWGAAPQKPEQQTGFRNQTLRLVVHTSIGGDRARVRLSNTFGTAPVRVDGAFVARRGSGATVSGTNVRLTFDGKPNVILPEGGDVLSDPAALAVPALSDLAVSLYLPQDSGPPTGHADFGNAHQTSYLAAGDHAADRAGSAFTTPTTSWFFLSALSVRARHAEAVVTLGDSITDGTASSTDTDSRYPDFLARRLAAERSRHRRGVLNEGIGGNELLRTSACCGASPSALARLDRDVLAQDGVRDVILLEGINDIGGDHHADAASLIAGMTQVIAQLRAHHLRVLGGTITPSFGRDGAYGTQHSEDVRQAVNRWIRASHAFDAVVDFDAAVRDPADPRRLRAEYDSGDHLHPNDRGYRAMAGAVPLGRL